MNTRLQVEHPITEAITGLDLVRAQLLVAAGEPLPFTQADVASRGHAIECRIYAEDSRAAAAAVRTAAALPRAVGPGIRVDSGVREGQTVTVHYDPLLAKLIAHGATRDEALARMTDGARASTRFSACGTTSRFCARCWRGPRSSRHDVHTRFIEEHLDELTREPRAALRAGRGRARGAGRDARAGAARPSDAASRVALRSVADARADLW